MRDPRLPQEDELTVILALLGLSLIVLGAVLIAAPPAVFWGW